MAKVKLNITSTALPPFETTIFTTLGDCVKPKSKEARMDAIRNAIARGTLVVRWNSARRIEKNCFRLELDMKRNLIAHFVEFLFLEGL
ncbi:hypothetical protein DPMN_007228 [Dreissena polymorpha]|uniref:Uncharacterized protein n=1 Tax=Dreissena polymorpha TaxID=45954 RepID=A0A9D4RY73_DREPO|nr:hypothetical protein DPMN_007228 [Dreissena polymorpha]